MGLPKIDDKVWAEIITGKQRISFESLPIKIFLGAALVNYQKDNSRLEELAQNLFKIFETNQNLHSIQKDIEKLK